MDVALAPLGLLAALAVVVAGSYHLIFRRPLPRTSGELEVDGLRAPVEVCRDRWGVPHIQARDRLDGAFAVGFVQGQDRLWQMELHRRIAAGRLSEVVGKQGVPVDQLMRKLGLRRVSEAEWHVTQAAGEMRAVLEAFSAGVNAAMRSGPLAAEFSILRHHPEPWQPEDSLAVGRLLSFTQSGNWEAQLIRIRMLKELGPELASAIDPAYPAANPRVEAEPVEGEWGADLIDQLSAADHLLPLSSWVAGSNTWAVHGTRTASGKPILANDPHGALTMPSSWHQVHLETPENEIAGLAFLGTPFIAFGHNRDVAWGIVNAQVSIQSLYVERLNPNNPLQFEDGGGWQDAVRFREVIRVRGAEPVVEDVLVTRHGPVISNAIPGKQPPISLRWVGFDSEVDSLGWAMRLNQAHDWKSFRFAVGSCAAPAMVVSYADVAGNIGFRLMGFIPRRPADQGRLPVPGWDGSGEWLGFVPFEEVPEALNPESGFIVAANNPIAFPRHPLVFEPATGYRARRILDVVGANSSLTIEDCVRLQGDLDSLPGRTLRDLVMARFDTGAGAAPGDDDLALGLVVLRDWNGQLDRDSAGGCVYEGLLERLVDQMIGSRLSPALREQVLGRSVHSFLPTGPFSGRLTPAVLGALAEGRPAPDAPVDPVRCDRVLAECLVAVVRDLKRRRGPDPRRWRWGEEHKVLYGHPVADAFALLRPLLNRGPFPGAGDTDTVRLMGHAGGAGNVTPPTAAICRAVYDLADWTRSVISHSPGQSGHPASPNYDDMTADYLDGRPLAMEFGPGSHDQSRRNNRVLRLLPGAGRALPSESGP